MANEIQRYRPNLMPSAIQSRAKLPRSLPRPEKGGCIIFSKTINPRYRMIFFPVASATIEFSRRSRDAGIGADRPRGLKRTAKFNASIKRRWLSK